MKTISALIESYEIPTEVIIYFSQSHCTVSPQNDTFLLVYTVFLCYIKPEIGAWGGACVEYICSIYTVYEASRVLSLAPEGLKL